MSADPTDLGQALKGQRLGFRCRTSGCHGESEHGRIVLGSSTAFADLDDALDGANAVGLEAANDGVVILLHQIAFSDVVTYGVNPLHSRILSERRCAAHSLSVTLLLAIMVTPLANRAATPLQLNWTNNTLTVSDARIPGGKIEIWYLEAFCHRGSTKRDWNQTTLPQHTELLSASEDHSRVRLRTRVEPGVEVLHEIRAGADEVDFQMTLQNKTREPVDLDWLQPCLRVDRFTGLAQSNYISRCFIFTEHGLTMLDKTRRTEEALYRGGQVYVPKDISLDDVNPRPISLDRPVNGLIGCFSADGRYLLAMAWDKTQELFQGVIVCIHNDPRVGGLNAGQVKNLHGKLYFLKNDPQALLARYNRDLPKPPSP